MRREVVGPFERSGIAAQPEIAAGKGQRLRRFQDHEIRIIPIDVAISALIALESTREAIAGYLEAAARDGIPLPRGGPEPSIVELEVSLP